MEEVFFYSLYVKDNNVQAEQAIMILQKMCIFSHLYEKLKLVRFNMNSQIVAPGLYLP